MPRFTDNDAANAAIGILVIVAVGLMAWILGSGR
jgi:hypothetical protein